MYTKLTIACALITGLLLLSTCMGGAQGSLLNDSAMRAAIGHSEDECDDVKAVTCGTVGDGCKSCASTNGSILTPCPDNAETILDETYHLCEGSGALTCRVEGQMTCGQSYICDMDFHDGWKCVNDPFGQKTCEKGYPGYMCRTCQRGDAIGGLHTVIDYYCL